MSDRPRACGICYYWRRHDDDINANGVKPERTGGCYRKPPRVFPVTGDMGQTLRIETHVPEMREDDWCGEYTEDYRKIKAAL